MSTTEQVAPARDAAIHYRITVDLYHDMLARGDLEDGAPYELLDGQIIRKDRSAAGEDPMTIGTRHVASCTLLGDLNPKLHRQGCYMRVQAPVTLPPYDEPEPDGLIVRGRATDYIARHPLAAHVLCVIEVADSSLARDRGYKQRIYADSGLPLYLIWNLIDDVIEQYTDPMKGKGRYATVTTLSLKDSVSLPTASGKPIVVPVRRLIPPV